jgi:hypothetical protein
MHLHYPDEVIVGDKCYKIPFAEDIPFDEKQFADLENDIQEAKEVQIPIILWKEKSTTTTETVVDGVHRLLIAAKLGLAQVPTEYRFYASEEEARSACRRINVHRRQLTAEQLAQLRTERIKRVAEMRKDGMSTRAIAKQEGVSSTTIVFDLKDAKKAGIPVEPTGGKVIGRDGRRQPSNRRRPEQVFGDPIHFPGLRYAPINEQGVVFLFGMVARELGFQVEAIQAPYPDCVGKRRIKDGKWKHVRIEFEFVSRNFKDHGHDPVGCDLIDCWEHNWPECPIEVLELKKEIDQLEA